MLSLIFSNLENVWNELKLVYKGSFKNLVYGDLPNEAEILSTLGTIKQRLESITWTIKTEKN